MAGAAEVDDSFCRWAAVGEGVDMGHDIVAEVAFVFCGVVHVLVGDIEGGFHFVDLLVGYFEAAGLLGLGYCEPDFSPGGELVSRGPDFAHFGGCVSGGEGGGVGVVGVCLWHG